MKLIGSTTSPFARKVRVALIEKNRPFDWQTDDVWSPESKVSTANPLGKVPCLVRDDGFALFDSRVILDFLEEEWPTPSLVPASGQARLEVKRWEALADGIAEAAILVRLEDAQRQPGERSQKWVARQWGKVEAGLTFAAKSLGPEWASGNSFSLADVALISCLEWIAFRFPDNDWRQRWPVLAAYQTRLAQRPSFALTRPAL